MAEWHAAANKAAARAAADMELKLVLLLQDNKLESVQPGPLVAIVETCKDTTEAVVLYVH